MKRKLVALLCALAVVAGAIPSASALTGEKTLAADTLSTLGIVNGTGGDSGYALSGTATRAQAVAVIVRLAGCSTKAAATTVRTGFTDLPAWASDTVSYAYGQGWVSGTGDTTFSPNAAISANAYCAFLLRMLGYREDTGDFVYTDAMGFAQRIGLVSQSDTGIFTRGDLFAMTAGALTFAYKGTSETVIERLVSDGAVTQAAANALGLLNTQLTARQIWDRYHAAVFCLNTYESQLYIDAKEPSANASGFFIDSEGIAVTNYHAISGAIYATVTLSSGEVYEVERVLYYDQAADLAVIRVSQTSLTGVKTSAFASLEMVSSDTVCNGDTVYAIGNPLGLGLTVSAGVVASSSRAVDSYSQPCIVNSADISQGSSGGALFNVYGQVVGITSGAYVYGNSMYLAAYTNLLLTADLSGTGWTLKEVAAIQATADAANTAA